MGAQLEPSAPSGGRHAVAQHLGGVEVDILVIGCPLGVDLENPRRRIQIFENFLCLGGPQDVLAVDPGLQRGPHELVEADGFEVVHRVLSASSSCSAAKNPA